MFSPRRTSIRTLFAPFLAKLRRVRLDVGYRLPIDLEDHVAAPETRVRGRAARIDGRDEHAAHVAREAQGLGDLGSQILHGQAEASASPLAT